MVRVLGRYDLLNQILIDTTIDSIHKSENTLTIDQLSQVADNVLSMRVKGSICINDAVRYQILVEKNKPILFVPLGTTYYVPTAHTSFYLIIFYQDYVPKGTSPSIEPLIRI